jgi:hypothetical protein
MRFEILETQAVGGLVAKDSEHAMGVWAREVTSSMV